MYILFPSYCFSPQDGDAWYVVEAAWVQRWLAFIQGDDASKKPGPIRNETLLVRATENEQQCGVDEGSPVCLCAERSSKARAPGTGRDGDDHLNVSEREPPRLPRGHQALHGLD